MGSGGGGSETRTITNNSPPQILDEGKEGYNLSNEFYRGILTNPPTYTGERVAPFAPAQDEALKQQRGYFAQPQDFQLASEKQVFDTASGSNKWNGPITGTSSASPYSAQIQGAQSGWDVDPRYDYEAMTDEEMQTAIRHASEPILADLEENIMPQIRDSSQLAGQGATSTRSDVARQKAVEGYGRTVGSSVIAPLMEQREQLSQDFDKAMQAYLQATAEGDANRATEAQIEMARINAQSHDNANQINAQSSEGAANRSLQAWDSERNRELTAAGMSGDMLKNESFRINQLFSAGLIDQQQYQRMLDSDREVFEEPLYRQSQAAQALSGMSGLGPGSGETISTMDEGGGDSTMDTISTIVMIAGIAAKAMCSEEFKSGIVEPDSKEIVDGILALGIKNWHYKWEPDNKMLGPILEDCPSWLHDKLPKHLNVLNLISGLVLTIQSQNKRLEALENVLSSEKSSRINSIL